ncbi:UPF0481 protein At3g47200-like [Corylus avellana]|uniref:UPF0481 protein At3g47200-like n=1 Tax=Corylus avellana TaxID=13451 RepID=UPI00286C041F|nr:UPF0481 protein At3g47200-like [Corylus avellana]
MELYLPAISAGKGTCEESVMIDIPCEESEVWSECCIYKVPKKLRKVNEEAYTPKLVSIGPFHHDLVELWGVKIQRHVYLKKFCLRTGKSEKDLVSIIESKKEEIYRSYSETFELISNSKEFVAKILLDAIFIIELFLRNFEREKYEKLDYILSNAWIESHIKQDLILLENQLPFRFLQKLYKSAFDGEEATPFLKLACEFFFSGKHQIPMDKEVKHFTDLHRIFYSPSYPKPDPKPAKHLRYTATKLYETGLEFEALVDIDSSQKSLLDIEFAKDKLLERHPFLNLSWLFSCLPCLKSRQCSKSVRCILKVPQLVIDDQTEALFRNLMALEQCHYPSNTYICNYVLFLDYLITTKEDVCLLVEKKVIVNRRGSSKAVTTLINTLGHEIVERESCYYNLYQRLNEHCDDSWNCLVASLTSVYFKDFWRGTATIAGIFVLGVTFVNFLRPFVMKN